MRKHLSVALATVLAVAAAPLWSGPVAAQAATISTGVVRSYQVNVGTAEYEQLRGWLSGAIARSGHNVGAQDNVDPANVGGTITIQVTHHNVAPTGVTPMDPIMPAPPWTPGTTGYSNGDTAVVGSCGGGWSQTWNLTFTVGADGQGTWIVSSYSAIRKTSCSSSGA